MRERRAGWAPPRIYLLSFVLSLERLLFFRGEGVFRLFFPYGGWGPYYYRLGRSGAREMVT